MKALGVLVMMALVVGAFTSIPNVSAIGEYGDIQFTKAKGTFQPKHGSNSGVCGIELCGSKSIPVVNQEKTVIVTGNNDAKTEALNRALQGSEASAIINEYNEFKGIKPIEITNSTKDIDMSEFNAFANPDFLNQKATSTVMKESDEMTIEEKKQAQVEDAKANFPNYIRESYANSEHPVYVPTVKPMTIENVTSSELIKDDMLMMKNMTGSEFEADLILFNMGFDIDLTKIGVCGPGTELVNGICLVEGEMPESVNTDWADFWDTKEDKEIVLEDVMMTNGTSAIPVVEEIEGESEMIIGMEEPVEEPMEESVVIPSFEESMIGSNSTSIDIEEVEAPEPIPEPVDTTVTVDGKTFKDQASADRFLSLKGSTEPVVEEVVEEPVVEEVIPEPEVEIGFEEEQTEDTPAEEVNPRLNNQSPPPFQEGQ